MFNVLLLSALVASPAAPAVQVTGASASVGEGRVVIQVQATVPLLPEGARVELRDRRAVLLLKEAGLDRSVSFAASPLAIAGAQLPDEVQLGVDLGAVACGGRPRIDPVAAGLRVTLDCPGAHASALAHEAPAVGAPTARDLRDALEARNARDPLLSPPAEPQAPASTASLGWLWGAGALLALGGATAWARQKKASTAHHIEILESSSLGPKRALVVARLGDELLILGTSEAGVHLLATRPVAVPEAFSAPAIPFPVAVPRSSAPTEPRPLALVGDDALAAPETVHRRETTGPRRAASFEDLLTESAEDEHLRRQLAAGLAGRAP
jgi:flagellar biogenesis protein FliO